MGKSLWTRIGRDLTLFQKIRATMDAHPGTQFIWEDIVPMTLVSVLSEDWRDTEVAFHEPRGETEGERAPSPSFEDLGLSF